MPDEQERSPSVYSHQVRALVEAAGAAGAPPDAYAGKRVAARFAAGIQLDVTTDPHTPSCTWPVIMHNVSDEGFAFWSKRQLRRGGDVWAREFTSDNSAGWLHAVVTHCTVGIKGYLVGAAFVAPSEAPGSTSGSTRQGVDE